MFKLSFSVILLMILSGCDNSTKGGSEQLGEIQKQLNLLTEEVVGLREEVAGLGSVVPNKEKKKLQKLAVDKDVTVLGDAKAKYAIVEYMDYQCPYCLRHAKKVLPSLKRKYIDTGMVKYIVKDFPLEFHSQAKNAAIFARCAAEQGKFEQAHDLLVFRKEKLNNDFYGKLTSELSLERNQYLSCFNSEDNRKQLDREFNQATRLGVSGTPRFFIGKIEQGELVNIVSMSGARSLASFEKVLTELLKDSE